MNPHTEAKYLLHRHAFEELGAVRVQLKTDARNLQSQAAIERLGAVREGILRKHMLVRDGFIFGLCSQDPTSSVIAARAFTNDLFRRGRVDAEAELKDIFFHPRAFKTHTLKKVGKAFRLERTLFDCGLRHW